MCVARCTGVANEQDARFDVIAVDAGPRAERAVPQVGSRMTAAHNSEPANEEGEGEAI